MEKIQKLVKDGKLSKTLMTDKEFINGAKEIFKSEKIDIDDKKLAELMNQIEAQLQKSNILDDKALEEVSGGITAKGVGRGVVKTVTTVAGAAVGMLAGGLTGLVTTGVAMGTMDKKEATAPEIVASVGGLGAGGAGGGVLGYKLGKWICKKTGLEEA